MYPCGWVIETSLFDLYDELEEFVVLYRLLVVLVTMETVMVSWMQVQLVNLVLKQDHAKDHSQVSANGIGSDCQAMDRDVYLVQF